MARSCCLEQTRSKKIQKRLVPLKRKIELLQFDIPLMCPFAEAIPLLVEAQKLEIELKHAEKLRSS